MGDRAAVVSARRPPSARPRPPPASTTATTQAPAEILEDDGIADDDETWLFSVRDPMTTEEISRMGFTNVILLNAARWRSDDGGEASAAVAAAADIHYCFGMKGEPVDSLVAGNRARMEEMLISGFCGRGDLLIVIQNATDSDSAVDLSEPGLVVVGRLVDMIEKAFETASEALVPDLAGVSVVLEGISAADLPILSVTWDDGSSRTLELTSA